MSESNEYKEFFQGQPRDKARWTCVEIKSPSIGAFRLIKDYIGDKDLNDLDGILRTFNGADVSVPEKAILASDDTEKGAIAFERIGYDALTEVRKLDNASSPEDVTVNVLTYFEGNLDPDTYYQVYAKDFTFTKRGFEIALTTENLNKQTKANQIITADEFEGLRNI
jgi:adenylate cyclase class IV